MARLAALVLTVLVGSAGLAAAQDQNPLTAALKAQHDLIKGNIVKAAAKVDEADYTLKPTPEVRDFAALLGHIANANYMICAMASGEKSPAPADVEKTARDKASLAKALDASFAYCDGVFGKVTDTTGLETVKYFLGEQPRLAVLAFNNAHNMEHYGNVVTYMRMKGLVPPSSEGR